MAKSNRAKGAYYLKRTIDHFKELGWKVEKLEVAIPFFIRGRAIFSRRDLLGADLFIWKGEECRIVQVKSGEADSVGDMRLKAKKQLDEFNVPLPRMVAIWKSRQEPVIEFV